MGNDALKSCSHVSSRENTRLERNGGLFLHTSSSRRAAAIQPGACFGLVLVTDLSSRRAFLMSLISASDDTFMLFRSVR